MPADKANPTASKVRWQHYLHRLFSWLGWVFLGLLFTFVILVTVTRQWFVGHRHPAVDEGKATAAGRVMRVELYGGLFARSLVETDTAFYAVANGMSLDKGEALTVFEKPNGYRTLCDAQLRCAPLLPYAR